jgi:hypothetical protein
VGDEVVVECTPLRHGRAGPEEGFIEEDSQGTGDAERRACVFHGISQDADRKVILGVGGHWPDSQKQRNANRKFCEVNVVGRS